MLPNLLIFGVIALVTIASAIAMLATKNPVFAVLFLVVNFITVAVLYLILGAPFIAMAQITVYAGAIMVLFLFVIMMLGTEKMNLRETIKGQRWITVILALVFLALITILILNQFGDFQYMPAPEKGFGHPQDVGALLFERYMLPILVISLILLVSTVGAVVLTRRTVQAQPVTPVENTPADAGKEGS